MNNLPTDVKKFSEYERGFLEGVIDSDGCLHFAKYKRSMRPRGFQWSARLLIGNTNRSLLEKIQKIVGFGHIHKIPVKKGKQPYVYQLGSKPLLNLLLQIRLTVKEKQRLLFIEAIRLLSEHRHHHTPHDDRLQEIYLEMRNLNRRGPPK